MAILRHMDAWCILQAHLFARAGRKSAVTENRSNADPRFDLGFDRILSARGVCHGASLTLSGPDQLVACGQRVWIQSGELPVSELLFLH